MLVIIYTTFHYPCMRIKKDMGNNQILLLYINMLITMPVLMQKLYFKGVNQKQKTIHDLTIEIEVENNF